MITFSVTGIIFERSELWLERGSRNVFESMDEMKAVSGKVKIRNQSAEF